MADNTDQKVNGPTIITESALTDRLKEMLGKVDREKLEWGLTTDEPNKIVLGNTIIDRADVPEEYIDDIIDIEQAQKRSRESSQPPVKRRGTSRRFMSTTPKPAERAELPAERAPTEMPDDDPPIEVKVPLKREDKLVGDFKDLDDGTDDAVIVKPKAGDLASVPVVAPTEFDPNNPPIPPPAPPGSNEVWRPDDGDYDESPTTGSSKQEIQPEGKVESIPEKPPETPVSARLRKLAKIPPALIPKGIGIWVVGVPMHIIEAATAATVKPPAPTLEPEPAETTLVGMLSTNSPPTAAPIPGSPMEKLVDDKKQNPASKTMIWLGTVGGLISGFICGLITGTVAIKHWPEIPDRSIAVVVAEPTTKPVAPPPPAPPPPDSIKVVTETVTSSPVVAPEVGFTIEQTVESESGETCVSGTLHGIKDVTVAGEEFVYLCAKGAKAGTDGDSQGCVKPGDGSYVCAAEIAAEMAYATDLAHGTFTVRGITVYCDNDRGHQDGQVACTLKAKAE